MPKFINPWTPEKLKSFTYSQLIDMKQKAVINDHKDLAEWCDFELSKRPPPPVDPKARKFGVSGTRKRGRAPSIIAAEKELVSELEKLGRSLAEKYDLSVETARKLSKGFRYFPHFFDGKAKVGGAKRLGRVAVNKSLSYRLKEDVFAIAGVIEFDQPVESISFMVFAPKEFLSNYVPLRELMPSLQDGDSLGNIYGGQCFNNFDEAAEVYMSIINRIAPRRD